MSNTELHCKFLEQDVRETFIEGAALNVIFQIASFTLVSAVLNLTSSNNRYLS